MSYKIKINFIFLCLIFLLTGCATGTGYGERPDVKQFIDQMSVKHNFNRTELTNLFNHVTPRKRVIASTSAPKESLEWYNYRPIFITSKRIHEGAVFWREHAKTLAYAQSRYGVPPEVVVAIIGVETFYGEHQGQHLVLDALSTLAFDYPRRAHYFRLELENYLLLTRDMPLNPLDVRGSYAGAIGEPQFMPSSYRSYAVDSNNKGYSDLIHNDDDAILSVANYFQGHGWMSGGLVAMRAKGQKHYYPDSKLLVLQGANGPEYWRTYHNFSVIMRYNTSPLYAMAVYQLSQMIKSEYYRG